MCVCVLNCSDQLLFHASPTYKSQETLSERWAPTGLWEQTSLPGPLVQGRPSPTLPPPLLPYTNTYTHTPPRKDQSDSCVASVTTDAPSGLKFEQRIFHVQELGAKEEVLATSRAHLPSQPLRIQAHVARTLRAGSLAAVQPHNSSQTPTA